MSQKKGEFFVSPEKLSYIVEGLKRADPDVQKEFALTFEEHIRECIARKIGNDADVEELVQDTMYAVYTSISTLDEPLALVAWVNKIARRQIYHFYHGMEMEEKRKAKAEKKASEKAEKERKRELRQSSGIDLSRPRIRDIVNDLPAEQKEAVILRNKGYKVREIAEIQGVSDGTVKSRLNYARIKVQDECDKQKS